MMSVTLLWWRYLSCRNQSIDLLCKSVDWFLRDRDLRHEKVNEGVSWFWYLVDYLTLPMWYLGLTVFQLRNSHTRARHIPTHRPYMHTINSSYFLNWHLSETAVVIWRYLNPLLKCIQQGFLYTEPIVAIMLRVISHAIRCPFTKFGIFLLIFLWS